MVLTNEQDLLAEADLEKVLEYEEWKKKETAPKQPFIYCPMTPRPNYQSEPQVYRNDVLGHSSVVVVISLNLRSALCSLTGPDLELH